MLHFKVHLRFHFKKHKKLQRMRKKDAFDVAADGPLGGTIKGAPLNFKFGCLRVPYIFYSAEETKLL